MQSGKKLGGELKKTTPKEKTAAGLPF